MPGGRGFPVPVMVALTRDRRAGPRGGPGSHAATGPCPVAVAAVGARRHWPQVAS